MNLFTYLTQLQASYSYVNHSCAPSVICSFSCVTLLTSTQIIHHKHKYTKFLGRSVVRYYCISGWTEGNTCACCVPQDLHNQESSRGQQASKHSSINPSPPACLCPVSCEWHKPNQGQSTRWPAFDTLLLHSQADAVCLSSFIHVQNLNVDLIKSTHPQMNTHIPQAFHHCFFYTYIQRTGLTCVSVPEMAQRYREKCTPAWILHYMCFALVAFHVCVFKPIITTSLL